MPFLAFDQQGTKGKAPWTPDLRRGVSNSGTKSAAVPILRPKFEEWSFPITMYLNDDECSESLFKQLVETAGRITGLCDFRPSKKGPFGKFVVKDWKIKKVNMEDELKKIA